MSDNTRKKYDSNFKLQVALAAMNNHESIDELCKKFNVATSQIYAWKKHFEENGHTIFIDKRKSENDDTWIHEKLEQVEAERDFLARVLKK